MKKHLTLILVMVFICSFNFLSASAANPEDKPVFIIDTTENGSKLIYINAYSVYEKEKAGTDPLMRDFKASRLIAEYKNYPVNAAISGNGKVGLAAVKDNKRAFYNLYKYELGENFSHRVMHSFWGKVTGIGINSDSSKIVVLSDDKKFHYLNKKGDFILLREFKETPSGACLTYDGSTALVVLEEKSLVSYKYDENSDRYLFSKELFKADPKERIISVTSDMKAGKIWLVIRNADESSKLIEGGLNKEFNHVLYSFDSSNKPWSVTLSGNGHTAYVAMGLGWIYRFVWNESEKLYMIDRMRY